MVRSFSLTDTGRERQLNQDYVFTSEISVGDFKNLFILADGMGGHKAGDRASRVAVETLVELIKEAPNTHPELSSFKEIVGHAIAEVNLRVRVESQNNPDFEGMGTTLVVAMIKDGVLHVANVGDSRLYVVGREMQQITQDHSVVAELVRRGQIDTDSARLHPNKNYITRAIGAEDDVKVDYFEHTLSADEIVLMCSDGLTNMVEDEDIRLIIQVEPDLVSKAEALIMKANENGGMDNISVVLLQTVE